MISHQEHNGGCMDLAACHLIDLHSILFRFIVASIVRFLIAEVLFCRRIILLFVIRIHRIVGKHLCAQQFGGRHTLTKKSIADGLSLIFQAIF